jgi:hypothetical protein
MAEGKASASREGLSLQTLVVAAVASGIAAVVVSHVWQDGTVLAAAMTPVVVSIVKELLQRPMQSDAVRRSASRVGSVAAAPARRVVTTGGTVRTRSGGVRTVEPPSEVSGAPASSGTNGSNGANGNGSRADGHDVIAAGPRRDYGAAGNARRRIRLSPRQWRIAIVTGVLAFAVAVAVLTLPELIFGGAVSSGHRTTIFGGSGGSSSEQKSKKNDQSNPNGGDQQQRDQTQPKGNTGTQPQTTQPTQPPSGTQTQTQPNQQQPPPSSQPPSGGGGGGGGGTQPAPQTPVPPPPVP